MRRCRPFLLCWALPLAVLPWPATAAELDIRTLAVAAAPGSLAPRLTAGGEGSIVLSWTEPYAEGHRLVYAVLGSGWGEPVTVASGADWFVNWADFPSVLRVAEERWAAHWLVRRPAGGYAYDIAIATSADGTRWSAAMTPHRDGTDSEHGFVTLYPNAAGFGAIWLDGRKTVLPAGSSRADNGMTLRAARFAAGPTAQDEAEIDGLVCDCCQTDVALAAGGPVAVYRDRSEGEIRDIAVARFAAGRWQSPARLAPDGWRIEGCPVNGPAIAAQGSRVAVAWFSAAGGEPRVQLAYSTDAGRHFGQPLEVTGEENYGRVRVVLLENGDAAVSWLCRVPGDGAVPCLRRVAADGSRGPIRTLNAGGTVPALSVPQLARAGDDLVMAWTLGAGGVTRIASARFAAAQL